DGALRIRNRHHFSAHVQALLDGELSHIARTRNGNGQAFQRLATVPEHFLGEIDGAVASRFRTNQAAPEGQAFAREYAAGGIRELLHHASHETDFTCANADVAGGYVGVWPKMTMQFQH